VRQQSEEIFNIQRIKAPILIEKSKTKPSCQIKAERFTITRPDRCDESPTTGIVSYASKAFTRLVSLEILREAFFLWIVPFDAVLAITGIAT